MTKVSVIIPLFRVEEYIERCINSVQAQSLKEWEIIAINDASPDNSASIVRSLAQEDNRIFIIENDKNYGPSFTRKRGYEVATGDYLFFLDGDDTIPSDALEILYKCAIQFDADIVKGSILKVTSEGDISNWKNNSMPFGDTKVGVLKALFKQSMSQNLAGGLFLADLVHSKNIISIDGLKNGEDALLLYQMVENSKGRICVLDEPTYYYHYNAFSTTHSKDSEEAIRSNLELQCFRRDMKCRYPELSDCIDEYITKCMVDHTIDNGRVMLTRLSKEMGLYDYMSVKYVLKYLGCKKLLLSLFPFIRRIRRLFV